MKKIIYTLAILYLIIILNVIFFVFNKDYNFFIKTIKYWDDFERISNINITDEYILREFPECIVDCNCEEYIIDKKFEELTNQEDLQEKNIPVTPEDTKLEEFDIQEDIYELNISEIKDLYRDILSLFKDYSFQDWFYEEYFEIFGLTYEYPQEYVVLQSDKIELYLFNNSNYSEMSNFFELLKYLWYTLNYVDNFWNRSFFINLDSPDWYVRLVIESGDLALWIKLHKDDYDNFRTLFEKL